MHFIAVKSLLIPRHFGRVVLGHSAITVNKLFDFSHERFSRLHDPLLVLPRTGIDHPSESVFAS
jgi:hypothetical protein